MATRDQLAHLLRRATFGPRASEVDRAVAAGAEATIAQLLHPAGADAAATATPMPSLGADPYAVTVPTGDRAARTRAAAQLRDQIRTATLWWLDRMVAADHQLAEKLVFFWHGHWATSVTKVRSAQLMLVQQQAFRRYGSGDFGALLRAMLRDPALLIWLDGQRNTRQAPNENLARELMELFTLGIGAYTEADVRNGARALTGWQVDRATAAAAFRPARHDPGTGTILGRSGTFDADGFAALLLAQPAQARFLARRLWFRFAGDGEVPAATLDRLATAYGARHDTTDLVGALLRDAAFPATAAGLVRQPVEWLVGALRQLEIRPSKLPDATARQLLTGLAALGQVPFQPPSVGGWPGGAAWLTTSAAEARVRLATTIAARAGTGPLAALTAVPAAQRPDALARLLVVDGWTARTRTVLAGTGGDPRRLIAIGLASPEYTVC